MKKHFISNINNTKIEDQIVMYITYIQKLVKSIFQKMMCDYDMVLLIFIIKTDNHTGKS